MTCCETLVNGISSSKLKELDLSNNNLTDAGIIRLSGGLKSSKLETLRSISNKISHFCNFQTSCFNIFCMFCLFRLRSCNLTEHSSDVLASVISSASCKLKALDLSDNDLQDVGIKKLCGGLGSPRCKLEALK